MNKNFLKRQAVVLIALLVIFQIVFLFFSADYTREKNVGRVYATLGVVSAGQSDLHKLNEAAHYFGQTVIGWTRFPHFVSRLKQTIGLDESVGFNAHMQERQNIVFELVSPAPLPDEKLFLVQGFVQSELERYNQNSSTRFVLTNVDTEQLDQTRTLKSGLLITLALSLIVFGFQLYLTEVMRRR